MISQIFSIVSIVLTVILALVVVLKARNGSKRGAYRQPIHLAAILLAAISACIVTTIVTRNAISAFEGKEIGEIIATFESATGSTMDGDVIDAISGIDADIICYIIAIPLAIIAPFIFLLVYIVASILFRIIAFIVVKACKIPKRVDTRGRTIGTALGVVEGCLVMAFILLPTTALLRIGVPALNSIETDNEEIAEVKDGINQFYESPVIQLIEFSGGEILADDLTTIKVKDSHINVSNELSVGIELGYKLSGVLENIEGGLTAEQQQDLKDAITLLRKSEFIPGVLSGAMNIVADKIDEFMPKAEGDADVAITKLTNELKNFLNTSTAATVVDDLETFVDLYLLLASNDIIDAISNNPEEAFTKLTEKDAAGKTLISKMINTLGSNRRTETLIGALNELSVSLMLSNMGVSGDTAVVYDELKTGINNVVSVKKEDYATEQEYKEELKTQVQGTINSAIDKILSDEIQVEISEEDKSKLEEFQATITDSNNEEMNEVMNEVADKVDEFLQQNPEIAAGGELDDAELLDFITSNFGDIFAEGGFSGFGGN